MILPHVPHKGFSQFFSAALLIVLLLVSYFEYWFLSGSSSCSNEFFLFSLVDSVFLHHDISVFTLYPWFLSLFHPNALREFPFWVSLTGLSSLTGSSSCSYFWVFLSLNVSFSCPYEVLLRLSTSVIKHSCFCKASLEKRLLLNSSIRITWTELNLYAVWHFSGATSRSPKQLQTVWMQVRRLSEGYTLSTFLFNNT